MRIDVLPASHRAAAIALWHATGLTRPWNDPAADLARALAGPDSTVLAGFDDDRLVATAMVGHDGHRGWVYYLGVDPQARHRGHGRALMQACEAWLRERQIPKLNLMVRGDNAPTRAFYAAIGYAQDDVVVLSKRLG